MAAKSAINLSVSADTSAARRALKSLDAEVDKMQKRASERSKKNKGSDGGLVPDLPPGKINLPSIPGLEKVTGALSKISGAAKNVGGSLGGMVSKLKGLNPVAAAALSGLTYLVKGIISLADAGKTAQADFEKINVSLSSLSKNMDAGDTSNLSKSIQLLAAEGVGSLEQLTGAAKTLLVAFDGNQTAVQKWLPIMDDISVATGMSADQFADLMARVKDSGEVEGRVFTTLQRQGIPVYEALAKALGVTGEEAKSAAKKGEVGMEEWMKTVEILHEKYKGLSAELSSNTLQGAIDTYTYMREMAFQGAAEAKNLQEIADKNARAADYKLAAFDQVLQTNLKAAGDLVGRVSNFFDRVKDAFSPENVVAGVMNFMSDITGETDNIAQSLVMASLEFRQIPNFAGQSAKTIGEYLASATDLYNKLDATLKNQSGISEETAADMRDAMVKIKERMTAAQDAVDEATRREAEEAERLTEATKAAEKAAAEQAAAAKKEAEERERNIKQMEEERLANIKDSEEYRQRLKEENARREAETEADKGTGLDFENAVEKFARAVAGMSVDDALQKYAELTDKIQFGSVEDITAEDKETHKRLETLIDEIKKLNATATRSDEKAAEEQRRARENVETDEERAARGVEEELQKYIADLRKSGLSEAEQSGRVAAKMLELMEKAEDGLISNQLNLPEDVNHSLLDMMDADERRAILSQSMTQKQIDLAEQEHKTSQAMLEALKKFDLIPTAQ